jgi:acetyl-CoA carboxylase biotin carboxyl carrier protein
MEFKQIQELIKAINKSNISELSVKDGEFQITIRQAEPETQSMAHHIQMQPVMMQSPQPLSIHAPAHAPHPVASGPAEPQANGTAIKSPMIGTFYRSSSPDKPVFVSVGDEVKPGQVLCIIEAMKVMNEIKAEVRGVVTQILVENAKPVEFGQPMFKVRPL